MNPGPKQPLFRGQRFLHQVFGSFLALLFALSLSSIVACGGSDKNYKIPVDAPELKPFAPPADEDFRDSSKDEWAEDVKDDDDDEVAPSTQPNPKSN